MRNSMATRLVLKIRRCKICLIEDTFLDYSCKYQEVSNQTRKRREGGVGGWVLAARLEKGGTFFPSPQRGNRPFPHMGRPTDKASSASRPPVEGASIWKWGLPYHQTRWGGGYRTNPGKIGLSLVKCFFAHLLVSTVQFYGIVPIVPTVVRVSSYLYIS